MRAVSLCQNIGPDSPSGSLGFGLERRGEEVQTAQDFFFFNRFFSSSIIMFMGMVCFGFILFGVHRVP